MMTLSFEQVAALLDEMREHDAQDVEIAPSGGSSNVVHVELSRDDEDSYVARGTISVAGTIRLDRRVTIVGQAIGGMSRVV
jgi:hypothetical protein